jgi:hypothetical protein
VKLVQRRGLTDDSGRETDGTEDIGGADSLALGLDELRWLRDGLKISALVAQLVSRMWMITE